MAKLTFERRSSRRGGKGIAEIFIDYGEYSYERRVCIGRLYAKFLTGEQQEAYMACVEKAISELRLPESKGRRVSKEMAESVKNVLQQLLDECRAGKITLNDDLVNDIERLVEE